MLVIKSSYENKTELNIEVKAKQTEITLSDGETINIESLINNLKEENGNSENYNYSTLSKIKINVNINDKLTNKSSSLDISFYTYLYLREPLTFFSLLKNNKKDLESGLKNISNSLCFHIYPKLGNRKMSPVSPWDTFLELFQKIYKQKLYIYETSILSNLQDKIRDQISSVNGPNSFIYGLLAELIVEIDNNPKAIEAFNETIATLKSGEHDLTTNNQPILFFFNSNNNNNNEHHESDKKQTSITLK